MEVSEKAFGNPNKYEELRIDLSGVSLSKQNKKKLEAASRKYSNVRILY